MRFDMMNSLIGLRSGGLGDSPETAEVSPVRSPFPGDLRLQPPDRPTTRGGDGVYFSGPAPRPRTLLDILRVTAAMFPTAPAIDDGCSVLDYTGLLHEVDEVGKQLAGAGIGRGDRVGVRVVSGSTELYLTI